MKNADRNFSILEAALKDQTYASIASDYGLCRERVRQIMLKCVRKVLWTYKRRDIDWSDKKELVKNRDIILALADKYRSEALKPIESNNQ